MAALGITLGIILFIVWMALVIWLLGLALDMTEHQWAEDLTIKVRWLFAFACVLVFAVPLGLVFSAEAQYKAKPFDGYVYKKNYYPAHSSIVIVGKVPVTQYYPARWNFVLKNSNDERSCDVSLETYSTINLGEDFHCGGY